MLRFHKDSFVDIDKYEERIRHTDHILFDLEKAASVLPYEQAVCDSYATIAKDIMVHNSGINCVSLSSSVIHNYLVTYEKCPAHYFNNRKTKGISLDKARCLIPAYENGYAKEFLANYIEYSSQKARCSKIAKMIKMFSGTNQVLDRNGNKLNEIPFHVNQQVNLRYNYKDYDVIAIPKAYNDCIGVEDGYFLAWGDFAQSDFRIAYNLLLRNKENAEIMDAYEDKYEALARLIDLANGLEFDAEVFQHDRAKYKKHTLATIYGTRGSVINDDNRFISHLVQYLEKCDKYREYERRINDRIKLGIPLLVNSYFGHVESIAIDNNHLATTVNHALNYPIQSCTSEMVILTVNAILDKFYDMGYDEDDISVYYVRHDEPVFKVRESLINDLWVLNDASTILVDNWTPLQLAFHFGYRYKVPDTKLETKISEVYKDNTDKLTMYNLKDITDEEKATSNSFFPLKEVFNLQIYCDSIGDNTLITFYNPIIKQVDYTLAHFDMKELDNVKNVIFKKIFDAVPEIISRGYKGIVVENNYVDSSMMLNNEIVKFIAVQDASMNYVCALSQYMKCIVAKRDCIEGINPPHKSFEEFILSVKRMDIFK